MGRILAEMKVGEGGAISEIKGGEKLSKRLSTLGIVVGANIKKLSQQALRGPVIVGLGRSKIAIGFSLAKKIMVEEIVNRESRIANREIDGGN
ncbi:ferrous iron transport protein A, partial [bacterium]|nr:ferrous iron transport protein A [bacterium]MBU2461510.1 ferrous iron transport protein A [bacterium]